MTEKLPKRPNDLIGRPPPSLGKQLAELRRLPAVPMPQAVAAALKARAAERAAAPVYADAHWVVERTGCPAPYTWRIVGTPEGAFPAYVEPMDSQLAAMARIAALWAEYAGYLNRIIDDLRAARGAAQEVLGDEGIGGAEFTPEACAAERKGGVR